ncbi:hypothetical protein C8Q80DRAFT_679844 [Daedaleopsis nitida]|nr:hypothetical protein C8Q80DRAFT_679844 [Daedaleopsis nitida]
MMSRHLELQRTIGTGLPSAGRTWTSKTQRAPSDQLHTLPHRDGTFTSMPGRMPAQADFFDTVGHSMAAQRSSRTSGMSLFRRRSCLGSMTANTTVLLRANRVHERGAGPKSTSMLFFAQRLDRKTTQDLGGPGRLLSAPARYVQGGEGKPSSTSLGANVLTHLCAYSQRHRVPFALLMCEFYPLVSVPSRQTAAGGVPVHLSRCLDGLQTECRLQVADCVRLRHASRLTRLLTNSFHATQVRGR